MERRASDLLAKPILTFDSGQEMARVEDLLVDPERNQVLALLIDKGAVWISPTVIPFGHIKAVGDTAILVPQREVVYEVRKDAELRRIYDNRTVVGMRVYSESGERLGTIGDMIIDDQTGEVLSYEVTGATGDTLVGTRSLAPGAVQTLGQKVLYVSAAMAEQLKAQPESTYGPPPLLSSPGSAPGASAVPLQEHARRLWDGVMQQTNRLGAPADPQAPARSMPTMDNRLLIGIAAVLLGALVLVWPEFLRVVVGLGLIAWGLWYALQNSNRGPAG